MPPRPLILHIDDDPDLPGGVPETLEEDGYEVAHTADPEEAMRLAQERRPALVLMELELRDCDGPDLMTGIREIDAGAIPVLVVTKAARDSALHGEAISLGVADFLGKPIGGAKLLNAIQEIAPLPGRIVRRAARAAAGLSGDLAETPMPELLARLRRRGATGLLRVRHGRLRVGVQLRNGSPVGVSSNRRSAVAEVVLHEAFRWQRGRFAFSEDGWLEPEAMLELAGDPAALLLTGVLDASPGEQVHERLAKRESLYVSCPDPAFSRFEAQGIQFTPEQREQLERLGGDDTLSVLLVSGTFGERLLYALWVAGWLELRTAPTLDLTELLGDAEPEVAEPAAAPPASKAVEREADEFRRAREERERELAALARSREEQERELERLARAREQRLSEIEELERAREARAQEHEALAPALEEQAREIEALGRTRARHARELQTLVRAREEHERELEELARAREERERAHEALAPALDERARELDELTEARAERARELEELTKARAERAGELEALARVREEHQREVEELARAREEHGRELATLAAALDERKRELETLEHARHEREREIASLARVREEHEREVAALAKVREESEAEIEALAQEHALLLREQEALTRETEALAAPSTAPDPVERAQPSDGPEPSHSPPEATARPAPPAPKEAPAQPSATTREEPAPTYGGLAVIAAKGDDAKSGSVGDAIRTLAKRVLSGDDFEALGITADATDAEVQRAYDATLREIPDIEPTAANLVHAQQAQRIRARADAAYANLRDAEKRRAYSLLREEEEQDRKAKPSAERALEGERWLRKGKAHLERKEYERAVEAFGMAAHLDPDQGEYASHLGYALFLSNPDDEVVQSEAMEHLAAGIKRAPRHEHSYLYLGRIMKAKGDVEVAKKIFKKALGIKRDFHPAIQELRVLEMRERTGKSVLSRLIGR